MLLCCCAAVLLCCCAAVRALCAQWGWRAGAATKCCFRVLLLGLWACQCCWMLLVDGAAAECFVRVLRVLLSKSCSGDILAGNDLVTNCATVQFGNLVLSQ